MENAVTANDIPGYVWVLFFFLGLLILTLKTKVRSSEEGTNKDWSELFSEAINDAIEEAERKNPWKNQD